MIKNFNFYDIYGYLIPGLTFLVQLWLPFGITTGEMPSEKWSTALAAVALGYVAGHILKNLFADLLRDDVLPSDSMLDQEDPTFSRALKLRLWAKIQTSFGLDVTQGGELPTVRREAFIACRTLLIQQKNVAYAEQFQGMYALMQGLFATFTLSAAFHLGWACGGIFTGFAFYSIPISGFAVRVVFLITLAIGIAGSVNTSGVQHKEAKIQAGFLVLLLFFVGSEPWMERTVAHRYLPYIWALVLADVVIARRCWKGYKNFAVLFAKAVYQGFLFTEKSGPEKEPDAE